MQDVMELDPLFPGLRGRAPFAGSLKGQLLSHRGMGQDITR